MNKLLSDDTVTRNIAFQPAIEEKVPLARITLRREIVLTWLGIAFTFMATAMVAMDFGVLLWTEARSGDWQMLAAHVLVSAIVSVLIYGGLVYLFARLAFVRRLRAHSQTPRPDTESVFDSRAPSICVLVPSYKEEQALVEMTLMSAALQDYPVKRVVLLLDDPPYPSAAEDQAQLQIMRKLPSQIEALFAEPRNEMRRAQAAYWQRATLQDLRTDEELQHLSRLYRLAATWMQQRMENYPSTDHATVVFVDKVLRRQRDNLLQRVHELEYLSKQTGLSDPAMMARLDREYQRLVGLFSVHLTSFERKRFVNLSHEPNKAMNLNSYLGLMGKRQTETRVDGGLLLEESPNGEIYVPWADYVITLDADSLLLTDYAQRLVHLMEQPENKRVAVVQTPYSAFPNAPGLLERIAGATTDIQYIIHQGFSAHGATYWVGANALLRRDALEDIVETENERGYSVKRFIQDRTVIEDTESTIDLLVKGWGLHNYPERLAYSATPPDFGSLLIQRRRWANGGLLILPKLISHLAGRTKSNPSFAEGFMRLHYLVSIAAVNIGLLILLAFPITSEMDSPWLPLTALAYFFFYGRDLVLMGYRKSDLIRVYAFNLLLIPINLGGVLTSIKQGLLKTKIPFGRTPKVHGRTMAPALYILAEFVLVGHWLVGVGFDLADERWAHALFAFVNAMLLGYAILRFMGVRESLQDVRSQLGLRLPEMRTSAPDHLEPTALPAKMESNDEGEKVRIPNIA